MFVGFQYGYVKPHKEAMRSRYLAHQVEETTKKAQEKYGTQNLRPRDILIKETGRVEISTPELVGSINLKGARIDDLSLKNYRETLDRNSPSIVLFSPYGSAEPHPAYYAEFGWLTNDAGVEMPSPDTVWQSDASALTPDRSVRLTWTNSKGIKFERTISVDDQAMFAISDRVTNSSKDNLSLYPFGAVVRQGVPHDLSSSAVHEGALGVFNGKLEEHKYTDLIEDEKKAADSTGGWLGITDKYWLAALIPPQDEKLIGEFIYNKAGASTPEKGFFKGDFRGSPVSISAGESIEYNTKLFAGAKRVNLLDKYAAQYDIPNFDRAIDFGLYYFLTRPFLYLLSTIEHAVGSMGLAILIFTVLLKVVTLPLSLKSYHSMSRMKALQPEIKRLQERYADDKVQQSQEIMELYKRERISPVSGCVPILIQIPIFFALYKVLYVNIEMRQAPFYGWIQDMSVADPTSVFNLFGYFDYTVPAALHIGLWPVLMGISMFLQQKMSPQPTTDKAQANMFKIMPVIFTYMMAKMPAGLVIYWTWSNLLGVIQQWYIMRKDENLKKA